MTFLDNDIFRQEYLGNSLLEWGAALLVVVGVLALVRVIGWALHRKLKNASATKNQIDDYLAELVTRTRLWLIAFPVVAIATRGLELSPGVMQIIRGAAVIAFLIQCGLWASVVAMLWITREQRSRMETDAAAATTISALGLVARIAIWAVVLLLALDNLGFEITTLVAGLGIGGVAVALAAQTVLGDLFASASIVIDKPFVIGDFIVVGEFLGTVEYIGLKTTRVRSLGGEQIIFSNADLLGSRVRNYKRMSERRVLFTIGVTYQTPREKLAKLPEIIRGIVESQELARFDRSHFHRFGPSSLDVETVYYVLDPEYVTYMNVQQAISLSLIEACEREGIEFAYPTQTVYLAGGDREIER